MQNFIKINDNDNVIVALNPIPAGTEITVSGKEGDICVTATEEIPAGHKMALCEIAEGSEVVKYGFRIGNAKENIHAGQWIHTHNVKTALGDLLDYTYEPVSVDIEEKEEATFMGFVRKDGKVGVRNEIWIIPTVGCVTVSYTHLTLPTMAVV